MNRIQRILNELDHGDKTVEEFTVGISGVYLRSMLNVLVELGMIFEKQTWPRTYSLISYEPADFLPPSVTTDTKRAFDLMYNLQIDSLDLSRVSQHIIHSIKTSEPDDLLRLQLIMKFAHAKITEALDNLEITEDDLEIKL